MIDMYIFRVSFLLICFLFACVFILSCVLFIPASVKRIANLYDNVLKPSYLKYHHVRQNEYAVLLRLSEHHTPEQYPKLEFGICMFVIVCGRTKS